MENMNSIFSLITLGCGIYCLYIWFKTKSSGEMPQNSLLLPRETTLDACLDQEEFFAYIMPRLLIFGAVITAFGAFGMVDANLGLIDQWTVNATPLVRLIVLELVTCVIPLAAVVWFAICLRKAHKELW